MKEDWYRKIEGQKVGPRVELVEEVRKRIGVDLVLSDSARFIEKVSNIFLKGEAAATVESAVKEARQVQLQSEGGERNMVLEGFVYGPESFLGLVAFDKITWLKDKRRDNPLTSDDKARLRLATHRLRHEVKTEMEMLQISNSATTDEVEIILNGIWDSIETTKERETILEICKWIQVLFDLDRDFASYRAFMGAIAYKYRSIFFQSRRALQIYGLHERLGERFAEVDFPTFLRPQYG